MNYINKSIFIEENDKEYNILIGRNAKGNTEIIKKGDPESLWFHFESISSCHIIIENNGDSIPKKYINQIARMLFEYKRNIPRNTNVIYTEIKNVKLTNALGTVITRNTRLIKF